MPVGGEMASTSLLSSSRTSTCLLERNEIVNRRVAAAAAVKTVNAGRQNENQDQATRCVTRVNKIAINAIRHSGKALRFHMTNMTIAHLLLFVAVCCSAESKTVSKQFQLHECVILITQFARYHTIYVNVYALFNLSRLLRSPPFEAVI